MIQALTYAVQKEYGIELSLKGFCAFQLNLVCCEVRKVISHNLTVILQRPSPFTPFLIYKSIDGRVISGRLGKGIEGRVTNPSTIKFWLKEKNPATATNKPKAAISLEDGENGASRRAT